MDPIMDASLGYLGSESSSSPPDSTHSHSQKRTAADAGLKPNGARPHKAVKRRASKACQCCRARKVRCNVVEHGAPCTNCRLDEVECIVSESKRKKKWPASETSPSSVKPQSKAASSPPQPGSAHHSPHDEPLKRTAEHVPHSLYQDLQAPVGLSSAGPRQNLFNPNLLLDLEQSGYNRHSLPTVIPGMPALLSPSHTLLPIYIKPLPSRLTPDDVAYLERKGALAIPPAHLRNELLRNYVEFVHPYMPLLDLRDYFQALDTSDGSHTVSLLLFQAVLFAGVATIDKRYLRAAGYATRRDARRDFFQKTRLLYDFDIEMDRISLIQSLLLMTYWYETPDDQKDSHHWMGIAVSLSHTIGLHRNHDNSTAMDAPKQKLWKRIWWCTFMRDRLIALGMRRPTKIKNGDFDVKMLTIDDFDIAALPDHLTCVPADCTILRDTEKQRRLAVMCIENAKLCMCISSVLSVQYSLLHNNHGVISDEGSTKTTMMLVARRLEPREDEVQACDSELRAWRDNLPREAQYVTPTWHDVDSGNESIVLHRSLLHMIYYASLSALHRPQVLPSTAAPPRNTQAEVVDFSRKAVRDAATEITSIANTLSNLDMVRRLPTPGITVLLPAIIIHLLDIKSPDESTRHASLQGFCQCMLILGKLRDIYAAADYSTAFLEAAIRKAEISLPQRPDEVKEPRNVITTAQGLIDASRRMNLAVGAHDPGTTDSGHLTPPPEEGTRPRPAGAAALTDDDLARRLHNYLASTPPGSDHQAGASEHHSVAGDPSCYDDRLGLAGKGANGPLFLDGAIAIQTDASPPEPDFDGFINLDAAGEIFSLEDGAFAAMQGESSGFTMDVDWMRGMHGGDGLASAVAAAE